MCHRRMGVVARSVHRNDVRSGIGRTTARIDGRPQRLTDVFDSMYYCFQICFTNEPFRKIRFLCFRCPGPRCRAA